MAAASQDGSGIVDRNLEFAADCHRRAENGEDLARTEQLVAGAYSTLGPGQSLRDDDRGQMSMVNRIVGLVFGIVIGGVLINVLVGLDIVSGSNQTVNVTNIADTAVAAFPIVALVGIALAGRAVMNIFG